VSNEVLINRDKLLMLRNRSVLISEYLVQTKKRSGPHLLDMYHSYTLGYLRYIYFVVWIMIKEKICTPKLCLFFCCCCYCFCVFLIISNTVPQTSIFMHLKVKLGNYSGTYSLSLIAFGYMNKIYLKLKFFEIL
jgi:hypothetical protein